MTGPIRSGELRVQSHNRLPDFIIIGAAKSGTTTLHQYFMQLLQTYVPHEKELEFFARDCIYARGLEWYASRFAKATVTQICGEASPSYTFYPWFSETSRRIHAVVPDAKLIYIVRHPVDRAFSHYYQRVKSARYLSRKGEDRHPQWNNHEIELCRMIQAAEQKGGLANGARFEDIIEQANWLVEAGRYQYQLEQYLRYFHRDQILILFFEDLVNIRIELLAKLLAFLGVDPSEANTAKDCVANTSTEHTRNIARDHIVASFRSIPGTKLIAGAIPSQIRQRLYSIIESTAYGKGVRQKYDPLAMLPETRQRLIAEYRDSNLWLQEFTGRDLSHWNI